MRFFKSAQYALSGIVKAFKSEKHIQFHFIAAVTAIVLAGILRFSVLEWAIVILVISGMIALEMINTAIETVVDLIHPEWGPVAGKIKDIAAGACLIYACGAAIIGVMLYTPKLINWLF